MVISNGLAAVHCDDRGRGTRSIVPLKTQREVEDGSVFLTSKGGNFPSSIAGSDDHDSR